MQQNNIELRVLVKGKPITEYSHNGQQFIEGRQGSEFEIEIVNRNPHRVEAIVSVDGLSVTDGKEAGANSSGYLVDAYGSVRIPGWKLSNEQVAAFYFAGKGGSYATQMTGSSTNNGVIGVMAFAEKVRQPVYSSPIAFGSVMRSTLSSHASGASYNAAPPRMRGLIPKGGAVAQAATASLNNLGTGFGEAQDFATTTVAFERGDLQVVMVVYYDNARGLKARGIQVGRPSRARYATTPQAFPTMGCKPPPGWEG